MTIRTALLVAGSIALGGCPSPTTTSTTPEPEVVAPAPDAEPVASETQPAAQSAEEVFAAQCREGLENAKALLPKLVEAGGDRTVDGFLVPYNDLLIELERSVATAGLMQSVHPDEAIRDAARACEQEAEKFGSELRLNRDLYAAFAAVDAAALDADTKRMVERALRSFRRAGVDRDDATRARLEQIDEELTQLGQTFYKNIVDDVRSIELTSVEQLAGLPEDFIQAHQPGDDGKIKITTNYPDLIPFLNYAEDAELRKQLHIANRSRGGEANEKVLAQILTLRHEKATTLGYASWADYITEDKMMKSAKNAQAFIARVAKIAAKRAKRDYKELLALKRKTDRKAKLVEDHEKYFYEHAVKRESYAFDAQSVRPYFPYAQTEQGLLDITSKVYDVTYAPVADAEVWHESVKVFDVMRGDTKLGRIYLDMHPREGKYNHAAQFTKRSGVEGRQLPEGVLVCNFPDPKAGPALMEHDDVTTMFHEFGHLMHHTFGGQQRWIDQSGVATEWDFVEAPSQMFEEWAWDHSTLSLFAKHHETGEVIPKDLVERMRRAHKFGLGLQTVQQMFYASISLNFHNVDPASLDMNKEVRRLQAKFTPFRFVEGTRFHASFGHLNGYTALYYTYMWSLVIAKDLLTPFKQHGLMNTEWTYRYRDRILAPGGTKDAADLVKDFLGRNYDFKAFQAFLDG